MVDDGSLNPIQWFVQLDKLNKLEFLTVIIMAYEIILSTFDFAVMASTQTVISEVTRGAIVIVIGTGIIRWRLGPNDFRFKMVVHILNIIVNTILVTAVIDGDNIEGINLFIYLSILIGHAFIIIVSIFATFKILEDYTLKLAEVSREVKAGDLSVQIEEPEFTEDKVLGPLTALINQILADSKNLFAQLRDANDIIQDSYQHLSSSADDMNHVVNEVTHSSQNMATGASNQAEMIANITENVSEANKELEQIIKSIKNNASSVTEISLKTKVLSLNAGIEASRAGEYGRGFAVVAENVRRLSEESRKSAEEISEVIDVITDSLRNIFEGIQGNIMEVSSVSEETAASAEELAASAEELSSNIEEVNAMAQELSTEFDRTNNVIKNINVK